jgi:hypothetical protein
VPFYMARAKGDRRSRWDFGGRRWLGFDRFEMEAAPRGDEAKGGALVFGR